jgi:hypothetical protein
MRRLYWRAGRRIRHHDRVLRRLAVVALGAVLVAGTLAAPAGARRSPTHAETAAIRAAVARYVAKPGPPGAPTRFRKAFVSTVNRSYALAKLATDDPVLATAVLRREKRGWKVVSYGVAGFPFAGVPVAVLNDLLGATLCHCSPAA